jgi:hypothetical protein
VVTVEVNVEVMVVVCEQTAGKITQMSVMHMAAVQKKVGLLGKGYACAAETTPCETTEHGWRGRIPLVWCDRLLIGGLFADFYASTKSCLVSDAKGGRG